MQFKIKYDFHVRKAARNKYNFDKSLFSITGDLIVADFKQARILSTQINSKRKSEGVYDKLVTAGQINALGLMHEIFHFLIRFYEEQINPNVFSRATDFLNNHIEPKELIKVLSEYINEFPPMEVFKGNITAEEYLKAVTGNKPNKEIIIEELILLHLENSNPAAVNLDELFTDKSLSKKTKYIETLDSIEEFFTTEKPFGEENLPLIQFLRKPVINSPYSIDEQLDYIRKKWGIYIFEKFNERLLKGKDLIMEDAKLFIQHGGGEKGTPPVPAYDPRFQKIRTKLSAGETLSENEKNFYYSETEQFTHDVDWMPKVVMIAKNAFVWADQLSKKYQREIKRLDQIPDEELDTLARWNFTSLWLIGIWQRSSASEKIKKFTGNPEAAASAYSLYDYVISKDFGGEESFENLKARAWMRGIRLASDMVPNHMGVFSKWVVEKPDYFIQTKNLPYPNYTFYGSNLSDDSRVEVRIEDKYYSHEDAAVVFERRDSYTGDIRYIYHGNDGTHMPWNDTAQLNLLNPEVRESLIQTIMHVARKTPIIRFDAAMTLAKKHFQRLWFPQPGTGGAIPSRSDFSMTRGAFDEALPVEFWREVVDRINSEMPDTLLLAEAFWLMEGYFVRTLGMHRVYNSAFMHMMMKEENNKYRQLIKNTLEFNPEILKRYVNFMSNPDEETAVNQFGKGDKYFGVSILMITFPGLPMFAHGQIEGYSEKYGMEYKRAYYNEFPDSNLISRHEHEIFPLISKRNLFSQVVNFELYDFIDNSGNINENVFAFTNQNDNEKTLIVYNNSYFECAGTINYSVNKNSNGSFSNKKLAAALNLKNDPKYFYLLRSHKSNLEYLYRGNDIHNYGMFLPLKGYEYHVYFNFTEIYDVNGNYERLYHSIGNQGVHSIEHLFIELNLLPIHNSFGALFSESSLEEFALFCFKEKNDPKSLQFVTSRLNGFLTEIENHKHLQLDKKEITNNIKDDFKTLNKFFRALEKERKKKNTPKWLSGIIRKINPEKKKEIVFSFYVINNVLSKINHNGNAFDELKLYKPLSSFLANSNGTGIDEKVNLIRILSVSDNLLNEHLSNFKNTGNYFPGKELANNLFDNKTKRFLNVNEFEGIRYFSKERFELLLHWIFVFSTCHSLKYFVKKSEKTARSKKVSVDINITSFKKYLKAKNAFVEKIKQGAKDSGYKVDQFKKQLLKEHDQENKSVKKKLKNLNQER